MATVTLKVGDVLAFCAPDGSTVHSTEPSVDLDIEDGALRSVVLTFAITEETWRRVDAGGWFGMPPRSRGQTFANGFQVDSLLFVTAALDAEALGRLAALPGDHWDWAAEVAEPVSVPRLAETESWIGLHVMQQRGSIRTGFSTKASGLV